MKLPVRSLIAMAFTALALSACDAAPHEAQPRYGQETAYVDVASSPEPIDPKCLRMTEVIDCGPAHMNVPVEMLSGTTVDLPEPFGGVRITSTFKNGVQTIKWRSTRADTVILGITVTGADGKDWRDNGEEVDTLITGKYIIKPGDVAIAFHVNAPNSDTLSQLKAAMASATPTP